MTPPDKTESLLAGRRAIDGLPGITLLRDYEWFEAVDKWALCLRVHIESLAGNPLETTEWYAVVEDSYPRGFLKLYPSMAGGIKDTYHHQSLNNEGIAGLPWRGGDLCLVSPTRQYGAGPENQDPVGSELRLLWHIERLVDWIECAAHGTLVQGGDPFELPPFPGLRGQERLVYSEGRETFHEWQNIGQRRGTCSLLAGKTSKEVFAVSDWMTLGGKPLISTAWGSALARPPSPARAFWIMLNRVPVVEKWKPPTTWRELHSAVAQQGLDLEVLLKPIVAATEAKGSAVLLVGFPIPRLEGQPDCEISWLAIHLPKSKGRLPNGFRKNATGYWMAYVRNVVGPAEIEWMPSANWHPSRLAARGQFSSSLRETRIVVLGLGALGSSVAELLARGGVKDLALIDGDELGAGNLSRHTLGMSDLGRNKAEAVAAMVSEVSPHLIVRAIPRKFTVGDGEAVDVVLRADCMIDCTGDDDALMALGSISSQAGGKLWLSASLSHGANSMLAFAAKPTDFSFDAYLRSGSDWLDEQQDRLAKNGVIFEGPGCWHPAFPGRNDDIRLLSGTLPHLLEQLLDSEPAQSAAFISRITRAPDAHLDVSLTRLRESS